MGSLVRPAKLRGAAAKLWDIYISQAYWLTWADVPKAFIWCCLQAEYEHAPKEMIASRIAQLRAVGSEIGFDAAARTRMGVCGNPGDAKPRPSSESKYFK